MAIQMRRGVYDDFDPDNLVPGEWAVVLRNDPNADDGRAAYVCFAAGDVKRVATFEDMVENILNADEDIVQQLTEGVQDVEDAIEAAEALRVTAEQNRASAENARANAESSRASAETARASAESGRVSAEQGRVSAETQRTTRFAELEQLANGWIIHHCSSSEYDSSTFVPTVGNPETGVLYLVPNQDASSDDGWVEWRWDDVSQQFEHVGSTHAQIDPITTAQIDSITSDTSVTGTENLQTTGLTYLWTKLKAAFAALTHTHSASDITSGSLSVARGGTGKSTHTSNAVITGNGTSAVKNVSTANGALYATSANGAASFGTLPVAQGGTGATSASGAKANLVDGQALAPASVTATGTVKAATIEDSGGTLAALRESVTYGEWAFDSLSTAGGRIKFTWETVDGYTCLRVFIVASTSSAEVLRFRVTGFPNIYS